MNVKLSKNKKCQKAKEGLGMEKMQKYSVCSDDYTTPKRLSI